MIRASPRSPARAVRQRRGAELGVLDPPRARPGNAKCRWGSGRTAWRLGCTPASTPASWPAPVSSTGAAGNSAWSSSRTLASKCTVGLTDSALKLTVHPSSAAISLGVEVDGFHQGGGDLVLRVAQVDPQVHPGRDDVGAAGNGLQPAHRGPGVPVLAAGVPDGHHHLGGGDHRVPAVLHEGGSGVVSLARDGQFPPAVAQDGRANRHGLVQVDQAPALFHVQLNEDAQLLQRLVVGADEPRILSVGRRHVGVGVAVLVPEVAGLVGVDVRRSAAASQGTRCRTGTLPPPETPRWPGAGGAGCRGF